MDEDALIREFVAFWNHAVDDLHVGKYLNTVSDRKLLLTFLSWLEIYKHLKLKEIDLYDEDK